MATDDGPDFTPGQTVLMRNFRGPELWALETARVVSDDARGTVTWIANGAPELHRQKADGGSVRGLAPELLEGVETVLAPCTWDGGGSLVLTPRRARHHVMFFFTPEEEFTGWYVNLQTPARRWQAGGIAGLDTRDQTLDLLVHPDRTWHWKDEDSFAERTGHPLYHSAQDAKEIRAEGERMARLAEQGGYPFDGTWCGFRPDPSWTVPDLPSGWDHPEGGGREQGDRSARLSQPMPAE